MQAAAVNSAKYSEYNISISEEVYDKFKEAQDDFETYKWSGLFVHKA